MKKNNIRDIFGIAAVVLFLLGGSYLKIREFFLPQAQLKLGGQVLTVELAKTPRAWQNGLSNRSQLAADHGMLFIFPESSRRSFWMKEMKFPIDIIWLQNGEIVDIAPKIPPASVEEDSPVTYWPRLPANAVLEVNAGFCEKYGVKIGDKAEILGQL